MICVLVFYKRRPDLSHDDFLDYWLRIHGPLALSATEVMRHVRRYVQHHIAPAPMFPGAASLEFDAFAEFWLDRIEDFGKIVSETQFQEMLLPDEAKFIDLEATRVMMLDEPHVLKGAHD